MVSTNDKSLRVTLAICSASFQALAHPSKLKISRLDMGRKSLTCARDRIATALRQPNAVAVSAKTIAAAPSETREQSVRFKGDATMGFFRHRITESKPRSFRICAYGLETPFLWFFAAIPQAPHFYRRTFEICLRYFSKHPSKAIFYIGFFL